MATDTWCEELEDLGALLMCEARWASALAGAIRECLAAVDQNLLHDADAWIALEERLEYQAVVMLWKHPEFGPILNALDYFCFTAQHNRDIVLGDIRMSDLRSLLTNCANILERGTVEEFPEALELFYQPPGPA